MTHATPLARLAASALLTMLSLQAGAAELGTYGDTWDIRERNLIAVLKDNLKQHFEGRSQADIEREMQQKAEDEAMRPPPVAGLTTGRETHHRLFDPSFTVQRDIADQNGVVFAHKGQKVNPFDVIPVFDETLYFIDADDERQIAWIKQQVPHTTTSRVILVSGNVRDSAQALGSRVYFDQTGSITKKFGITQVPAEVKQARCQKTAGKPFPLTSTANRVLRTWCGTSRSASVLSIAAITAPSLNRRATRRKTQGRAGSGISPVCR